jgi:eukaryotic-like serine/threonine-protein kinase
LTIDVDALRPRLAAALSDTLDLGDLLGEGGFAAVFRAHDPRLQRDVAIKVLDPALGITADLEEQFLREARIVAGVEHPHIVPLYGAESRDGLLYLVMRLLPGLTLSGRIAAEGALPPAEAARIAHEVAEALSLAHERRVVHRDIKPDNILLDAAGNATVTDFGVSLVTGRTGGEGAGVTVGTPSYMSPEQALGEELDGRSDVYSLGAMLFEMLTGRVPFEGRTVQELMAMHIATPPPKVSALRPDTPAALVTLVDRMLSKRPAQRPDATEASHALAAARAPDALLSPAQAQRRRRRKRTTYAAVVVATASLVTWGIATLGIKSFIAVSRALNQGDPPVLDAVGAAIPDSIIGAVRADGSLLPGEVPAYAFIPAHRTSDVAIVLTDSVLIVRSPTAPRRIPIAAANIDLNFNQKRGGPAAVGRMIVKVAGSRPDTVYAGLNGFELTRLSTSLMGLSRARTIAR